MVYGACHAAHIGEDLVIGDSIRERSEFAESHTVESRGSYELTRDLDRLDHDVPVEVGGQEVRIDDRCLERVRRGKSDRST